MPPPPPTPTPADQPPAQPRRKRGRALAIAAWLAIAASYLALVFAYALPQDFRNDAPTYIRLAWLAFMIRTFLFHAGLAWSLVAIAAACVRRWRLLAATLPLLALAFGPAVWNCRPKHPPAIAGEPITVMSVNLLAGNHNTGPIIAEVAAARPDVLLLLEYTPHWHAAFRQPLAADYPYVTHAIRQGSFGMAVYSRLPLAEPVNLELPLADSGTPQARAVVQVGDRRLAIYAVHLMPPKSARHTIRQRRELADLVEHLRAEELPVVLCGDFNFTSRSALAAALADLGLTDVHDISGFGRGTTWSVLGRMRYLPGIRIDHIYVSPELTSLTSRTGVGQGSDHRPVVAEIGSVDAE